MDKNINTIEEYTSGYLNKMLQYENDEYNE